MEYDKQKFTAVYQKRRNWIIGWIEEIPGVNTQGKTIKEVKTNLQEALKLILETNRDIIFIYNTPWLAAGLFINKELGHLKF